jgi:hypothetical protein
MILFIAIRERHSTTSFPTSKGFCSNYKRVWVSTADGTFTRRRPDGSFACHDGRFAALNGPTFRLLVAPTYLVEEFACVIMMVFHLHLAFDQIGDPLCGHHCCHERSAPS